MDESTGLHVLVGIAQSPMQSDTVVVIEPVSRIERQDLDFGAFRQVGRLIDDKSASLTRAFKVTGTQ
jgi:hypothetical protein